MINSVEWKMINYADSAKIIASIMELVEPRSLVCASMYSSTFSITQHFDRTTLRTQLKTQQNTNKNTGKYNWTHKENTIENTSKCSWKHNKMCLEVLKNMIESTTGILRKICLNVFVNFFNYSPFWQRGSGDTIENTSKELQN